MLFCSLTIMFCDEDQWEFRQTLGGTLFGSDRWHRSPPFSLFSNSLALFALHSAWQVTATAARKHQWCGVFLSLMSVPNCGSLSPLNLTSRIVEFLWFEVRWRWCHSVVSSPTVLIISSFNISFSIYFDDDGGGRRWWCRRGDAQTSVLSSYSFVVNFPTSQYF